MKTTTEKTITEMIEGVAELLIDAYELRWKVIQKLVNGTYPLGKYMQILELLEDTSKTVKHS